jgi:hypothetical protein
MTLRHPFLASSRTMSIWHPCFTSSIGTRRGAHEPRAFDLCELLRILFGFKKSQDGFMVIDGHSYGVNYFPLGILSRSYFNVEGHPYPLVGQKEPRGRE